jgi:choline dehydrogenase
MQNTFDYIVVGGGTAGIVVAVRLASETNASVCLVEAGPAAEHDMTVLDYRNWVSMFGGNYDFGYETEPLECNNTRMAHPRGKLLGGCSSHNTVIAFRAPDADLREWVRRGAKGWGPKAMWKTWQRVQQRTHTHPAPQVNTAEIAFIQAAQATGFPIKTANAKQDIVDGACWLHVNEVGGIRMSSATAYLFPMEGVPSNLTVLTETHVYRITLDEHQRATGVLTSRGQLAANKEVILCAGAVNSPQLLMLSGIGPAGHLAQVGVPVQVDLPSVGQHLQDHVESVLLFETTRPVPGTGSQHWQSALFARTRDDLKDFDLMIHFGSEGYYVNMDSYVLAAADNHLLCMTPNTARPHSEGFIQLRSNDPCDKPLIDPRYYTDAAGADVRTIVEGIKIARRVAAQSPLEEWIKQELAPGPAVQSDADLARYVKDTAATVYHLCGSCRMGAANNPDAVVDPQLRVRGVPNLRVADASIMPTMVGVNPCLTVMQIGERCADMIIGD